MVGILAALKIAAILVTGIFGAIGLKVDFKDKDNRITDWGRRALIGAVISTVIATIAQGLESAAQKSDSDKAQARSALLLNQILRTTYSLTDMKVSADAEVSLTHRAFDAYRKRLDAELPQIWRNELRRPSRPEIVGERMVIPWVFSKRPHGEVDGYGAVIPKGISAGSRLFPQRSKEPLAWFVLDDFGVEVRLYRNDASQGKPAFEFELTAINPVLEYDSRVPRMDILSEQMKITFVPSSTGTVQRPASLCDLAGTTMVVSFRYEDISDTATDRQYRDIMDHASKLHWIYLTVAGEGLFFRVADPTSRPARMGDNTLVLQKASPPTYQYTFPKNPGELPLNCPLLP